MRLEIRRSVESAVSMLIYWLAGCVALWRFYDVDPLIRGGYFSRSQAVTWVIEMGLILTILTAIAWLWSSRVEQKRTLRELWWSVVWRTLLILFLYMFAVLLRRELWTESQGVTDSAMFLPVVGRVNAVFLSESRWLIFLIEIIPSMSLLSGLLFCFQRHWAKNRSTGPVGSD